MNTKTINKRLIKNPFLLARMVEEIVSITNRINSDKDSITQKYEN